MSRGILLLNLGTPDAPTTSAVRRYLNEFLMDPHVITLPWPLRRLLVSAFVLPFRPSRTARAYQAIWTDAGSPLLCQTRQLTERLASSLDMPCEFAMRYGSPDITAALTRLSQAGCRELLAIPLFPQHADSTRSTAIKAVRKRLPQDMTLAVLPPFYQRRAYIESQALVIERHLPDPFDHLLLSYHGLPLQHLKRADPTGSHCLASAECCDQASPAHATCYRHQCYATSHALAARLRLAPEQVSVSFQSRLGSTPWISPYTDQVLTQLPERDVRHLAVACPAFVADNLETLEEIGIRGRAAFLAAGGASFTLIPCLNDMPEWVQALAGWIKREPAG